MHNFRPALVEWTDTTCFDEDRSIDDVLALQCVTFQTLGFIIEKSRNRIVLIGDIGSSGTMRDINIIPAGCVTKITYLESVKESK